MSKCRSTIGAEPGGRSGSVRSLATSGRPRRSRTSSAVSRSRRHQKAGPEMTSAQGPGQAHLLDDGRPGVPGRNLTRRRWLVRLDCQLGICAGMGVMGLSWQLMYPPVAVAPGLHGVQGFLHTIFIASAPCLHMPAAVLRCSGACYHQAITRRRCAAAAADPGSGTANVLVVSQLSSPGAPDPAAGTGPAARPRTASALSCPTFSGQGICG
jgi:hypothetical protein